MGGRASAFYSERKSDEAGVTVTKSPTVRIVMSAGVLRMLALIALPIVVAVIAVLAGADIGGGVGQRRDVPDRLHLAGHARLARLPLVGEATAPDVVVA
jgi:hypothetical protein